MIVIKKEHIRILRHYIDNLDDLIRQDDVQLLLDAVNDVIIENILDNDDEPDEEGIRLQKIWDEIFYLNE